MLQQSGLISKLKLSGSPAFNEGGIVYGVCYQHPFDENRYLRAKIGEKDRERRNQKYTELEDISLIPLGDTSKLVFVTDNKKELILRYLKKNDLYFVEKKFEKRISRIVPSSKLIKESSFEGLIREFSEEFAPIFQQDDKLRGYLSTWLKFFKDDYDRLNFQEKNI